jgi:hypothetical protein
MDHLFWPYGVIVLALSLILMEMRGQRSASNARAIALHVVGYVIPMLEGRGYTVYRKQVAFGRYPYIKFNMSSDHGLWIDLFVDHRIGYFHLSSTNRINGEPMNLSHSFEVSGPWDELSETNLIEFEDDFRDWRINGCRRALAKEAGHLITYYFPATCSYARQRDFSFSSPTDLAYKLHKRMDEAQPHQRYPLVPLLPCA